MKNSKKRIHIVPPYLLNPTNPISVNLIGAGGTGSTFLTALARMNHALREMNHSGLQVTLFDHDTIEPSNQGRQLFYDCELGMNKAVALINRTNRCLGTNWKAVADCYENVCKGRDSHQASLTISCVDTVDARKKINTILTAKQKSDNGRDRPLYLIDLGNGRDSGQAILSTVGQIPQPESIKFNPIGRLGDIFETYPNLLDASRDNHEPSCSLAQALNEQDLFINSVLSNMGASLLWSIFRLGVLETRGFFLNLSDFRSTPIPI